MAVLFDIGHPAHVHLFRNFIKYLQQKNIEVLVTAKEKDITLNLLDHYGIECLHTYKMHHSRFGKLVDVVTRTFGILRAVRGKNLSAAIGTSVSIPYLSLFYGIPSWQFNEDDDDIVPLFVYLAYPFSSHIIKPKCIRTKYFKDKTIFLNSMHELAYLHPDVFRFDPSVPVKYDLQPHNYAILRLNALKAHHDSNAAGIDGSLAGEIRSRLKMKVVTSEENKNNNVDVHEMHHLLAGARLLITDSQTMTVEAAALGVPVVQISSFSGKISLVSFLEEEFGLVHSFQPSDRENILSHLDEMLNDSHLDERYQEKRKKLLGQMINLNDWMIKTIPAE